MLAAAFAAHLVGHLDDNAHREFIRQIGEHVDTIAHELTELLGTPSGLSAPNAAAPDDRKVRDGAPMLTSAVGLPLLERRNRGRSPAHKRYAMQIERLRTALRAFRILMHRPCWVRPTSFGCPVTPTPR
jgi:hypothetical protein